MKNLNQLSSLAVILIAVSLGAPAHAAKSAKNDPCNDDSHYPLISLEEVKKAAESKTATIIDVNSSDSFQEAHVTGAIHFGSVKKDFAKALPADKNQMIIAYCGGPKCTAWKKAAKEACKMGYTNIKHFKEGLKGWRASTTQM